MATNNSINNKLTNPKIYTGSGSPTISADGLGSNIDVVVKGKGTGLFKFGTAELSLPNADGSANQMLSTDGSGALGFTYTLNDAGTSTTDLWSASKIASAISTGGTAALDDLTDVNATVYDAGRILVADGTDSYDSVVVSGDGSMGSTGALTVSSIEGDALDLGGNSVTFTTSGATTLTLPTSGTVVVTTDLAAYQLISEKGSANGYASLDAGGKVPSSQLPALALTNVNSVASEAAQLALTVEEGDVAIRTDENKTYIHNGGSAGTMADWTEMVSPTDAVTSVNGETGVVVLDTDDVSEGSLNLYYTEARVSANVDVAANTAARHVAVTLNASATTGGMSLSGQEISNQAATGAQNGYLTSTDWTTFNNKQGALTLGDLTETTSTLLTITGGTGAVVGAGLTIEVDDDLSQYDNSVSEFISESDLAVDGQLFIGNTSTGKSTVATLTAGSGISVTNGNGSITIASTGSETWTEVTGTTQAMTANNGYVANNAAQVVLTLPATAAIGDKIKVVGKGAGLYRIAQNAGQTIHFGGLSSTTGAAGYLEVDTTLGSRYDSIELVCITANTEFVVVDAVGNFDTDV